MLGLRADSRQSMFMRFCWDSRSLGVRGESRRDAMFMERLKSIDLGEPIYGRKTIGCAPKGALTSQLRASFYRHFTATRFFRQTPRVGRWISCLANLVLLNQAMAQRFADSFRLGIDVEFFVDAADVVADGVDADVHLPG